MNQNLKAKILNFISSKSEMNKILEGLTRSVISKIKIKKKKLQY